MRTLALCALVVLVGACDRNAPRGGTGDSDSPPVTGRNTQDQGDVGGNGKNYDRGGPPTRDLQNQVSGSKTNAAQQPNPGETGTAR